MDRRFGYSDNPYYDPDKCGLELLMSIDCGASWEFDIACLWRDKETGKLYYGDDAGCSCPTPFENHRGLSDLTEVRTLLDIPALRDGARGYSQRDIQDFMEVARVAL